MSHVTRIRTRMSRRERLKQALHDLGYQVTENAIFQGQFGNGPQQVPVDFLVGLPHQQATIAIRRVGDAFEILADWYLCPGTSRQQFVNQLTQRYAYLQTREQLLEQGFEIQNEQNVGGSIRLLLSRYDLGQAAGGQLTRHQIQTEISPAGDVAVTVSGMPGTSCLDATRSLEQGLGQVIDRQMTLEGVLNTGVAPRPDDDSQASQALPSQTDRERQR